MGFWSVALPLVSAIVSAGSAASSAGARKRALAAQRRANRANRRYGWASGFQGPSNTGPAGPSMLSEVASGALGGAVGGYELTQQHREKERRKGLEDRLWGMMAERAPRMSGYGVGESVPIYPPDTSGNR